eukprot:GHUV01023539.1.p2 GENE.GHUV01023539.1~~GHUV01023539.1.p2  ORF type:complete len:101 (+),score=15.61 GHUV01023539.1:271-573(+)
MAQLEGAVKRAKTTPMTAETVQNLLQELLQQVQQSTRDTGGAGGSCPAQALLLLLLCGLLFAALGYDLLLRLPCSCYTVIFHLLFGCIICFCCCASLLGT